MLSTQSRHPKTLDALTAFAGCMKASSNLIPAGYKMDFPASRTVRLMATASASQTRKSTPPSTKAKPSNTPKTVLQPLDPKIPFRETMRRLRKQYLAESLVALRVKEEEVGKQKEARAIARERLREEVRMFKEEMQQKNSALGPGGKGAKAGRQALDDALGTKTEGSLSTPPKTSVDAWQKYALARRRIRFTTELEGRQRLAKERIASMMYLFHASADFVTYRNLDAKIKEVFDQKFKYIPPGISHTNLVEQIKSLEADAKRAPHPAFVVSALAQADATMGSESPISRPVTGDVAEELLLKDSATRIPAKIYGERSASSISGLFKYTHGHKAPDLKPGSAGEEFVRSRGLALKDALEGTVASRPGQDAVKRWLRRHRLDEDVLPAGTEAKDGEDDVDEAAVKASSKNFKDTDALLNSVLTEFNLQKK
ncbi:hypothetical protein BC829DRAFT_390253 [Chytridium lagenaria]|nr:hypothetical protein BC829DRAFT_390253 [Chytridium lagenaria]